jgi:hypothetical protein
VPRGTAEGILETVNTRSDPSTGSALTAGRFLALVVLLVAFIAMHGLAAMNGDGIHHGPLAFFAAPDAHASVSTVVMTGDGLPDHGVGDHGAGGSRAGEAAPTGFEQHGGSGDGEGSHAATAGCLIALCGLVTFVLALAGRGALTGPMRELTALRQRLGVLRPDHRPPRRSPRISLCVLRV